MGTRRITKGSLLLVAATTCVAVAPAQARPHVSPHRAAQIRKALRSQVRHNPRVIERRWFLKRASLVNFKLPVTIRLRDSASANNPNSALNAPGGHQWDLTADEEKGIVTYLRSLKPLGF